MQCIRHQTSMTSPDSTRSRTVRYRKKCRVPFSSVMTVELCVDDGGDQQTSAERVSWRALGELYRAASSSGRDEDGLVEVRPDDCSRSSGPARRSVEQGHALMSSSSSRRYLGGRASRTEL